MAGLFILTVSNIISGVKKVRQIFRVILACLDGIVSVAERLLVLAMTAVVLHFGYHAWRGRLSANEKEMVPILGQNWKVVFVLMVPLFYQTIRTFLEEVQEAWGMKRPKRGAPEADETTDGRR